MASGRLPEACRGYPCLVRGQFESGRCSVDMWKDRMSSTLASWTNLPPLRLVQISLTSHCLKHLPIICTQRCLAKKSRGSGLPQVLRNSGRSRMLPARMQPARMQPARCYHLRVLGVEVKDIFLNCFLHDSSLGQISIVTN